MTKIVIIGGVAGGASAAARARRLSETAEITMFERGPFVSFANCGLPYHIGGDIRERSKLLLQTPESFRARFNVDVRILSEVIAINADDHTVTVRDLSSGHEYLHPYDKLLLSPGAAPITPPIPGLRNPLTHSLRNIPDMDDILASLQHNQPRHVTVVGGGYIGLEMMEAFVQRGLSTTLLEQADQVMTAVDREMAGFVHQHIRAKGVDLRLNCGLQAVQYQEADPLGKLKLSLADGRSLTTDLLIMAIGVKPELTLAQQAGLAIGPLGGIAVNAQMQTSVADIYAVGDAIEHPQFNDREPMLAPLAGPANRQGRMAADNMLGDNQLYSGTQGTAICKVFDLAVATTGFNERRLQAKGLNYHKAYVHAASHAGYYPGAEPVSFKLLFCPDSGAIYGAQAVGKDGVDKRIDVMAMAYRMGMTVEQLQQVELTYAPPFGSAKDVVNQAAFVASNSRAGLSELIHYHQLDALGDDAILLDVRNPAELSKLGQIEGSINIPVDELRQRMHELPQDKEIIVICQVGLRGHVATRQLLNRGYRARNLSGGFKTYAAAKL
ncbi:FAD-dependent oxidoreductase [uncultured Ferrimonas sp.]|uniref:FAD-dependent oxidoreductase n=1 Tax=uncultured Ferrimonas sp. TaxID=432640 RepID=UPI002618473C|nr:FAD-dependent oxidoreductase [uncultured Ferrimonas sp.]